LWRREEDSEEELEKEKGYNKNSKTNLEIELTGQISSYSPGECA
jgi:hypothetical protein